MSTSSGVFDYDVALSFAGEDRAYVGQVAALLKQQGIRVFYDEYAEVELWGNDLYVLLDEVYRKRARFTIIFVSYHYVSKPWTQHERQSAQARSLIDAGPYILPVRLDDSELPGLRPTVAYVDARNTSVERLAWLIEQKLSVTPGMAASRPPLLRSPRTAEQQRELLAERPDGWEFLLYAGVLWRGRQALESKWRDHELGYAHRTGRHFDDGDVLRFFGRVMGDLSQCTTNLMRMLDPHAYEPAFGPSGQPGDPALIEYIATRFIESYEEILDIAATLRGSGVSSDMRSLMDAGAHLTDAPLRQMRDFIDRTIAETDAIPDRLARDEPVTITLTLTIAVDDKAEEQVSREIERARRRLQHES